MFSSSLGSQSAYRQVLRNCFRLISTGLESHEQRSGFRRAVNCTLSEQRTRRGAGRGLVAGVAVTSCVSNAVRSVVVAFARRPYDFSVRCRPSPTPLALRVLIEFPLIVHSLLPLLPEPYNVRGNDPDSGRGHAAVGAGAIRQDYLRFPSCVYCTLNNLTMRSA